MLHGSEIPNKDFSALSIIIYDTFNAYKDIALRHRQYIDFNV